MSKASFPTLLHSRAKLLGGLTRFDLVALALMYLVLAQLPLPSLVALVLNMFFLLLLKLAQRRITTGFWRFVSSPCQLKWHGKLALVCRN
jgi:hypothetical protein